MKKTSISRRSFIGRLSLGAAVAAANPFDLYARALKPGKLLGIALVGLGKYSTGQLGPALKQTTMCKLAGVVTGSREKGEQWAKDYGFPVKNIYSYDTMQQLADNPDIDIVYIVTPNGLHAEHAIAAAKAGKHVICEKPMARTVAAGSTAASHVGRPGRPPQTALSSTFNVRPSLRRTSRTSRSRPPRDCPRGARKRPQPMTAGAPGAVRRPHTSGARVTRRSGQQAEEGCAMHAQPAREGLQRADEGRACRGQRPRVGQEPDEPAERAGRPGFVRICRVHGRFDFGDLSPGRCRRGSVERQSGQHVPEIAYGAPGVRGGDQRAVLAAVNDLAALDVVDDPAVLASYPDVHGALLVGPPPCQGAGTGNSR